MVAPLSSQLIAQTHRSQIAIASTGYNLIQSFCLVQIQQGFEDDPSISWVQRIGVVVFKPLWAAATMMATPFVCTLDLLNNSVQLIRRNSLFIEDLRPRWQVLIDIICCIWNIIICPFLILPALFVPEIVYLIHIPTAIHAAHEAPFHADA